MLEEMMQLVRLREGQGLVFTTETGGPVNPSNLPPAAFVRPASQEGEAGARSLPRPTADLRHPTLLAEHLPPKCPGAPKARCHSQAVYLLPGNTEYGRPRGLGYRRHVAMKFAS